VKRDEGSSEGKVAKLIITIDLANRRYNSRTLSADQVFIMESIEQRLEQTALEKTATSARNVHRWQKNLLPLMTRMLIALTTFFFVASCVQLIYLHRTIQNGPKVDTRDALSQLVVGAQATPEQILSTTRLRAIVTLEADSVEHQYHQASVALMSRLWITYLGFVTGMILALVGAAFILGKLDAPPSELAAKVGNSADVSFKSASPGLVLAVLGVILMITTVLTNHKIEINHTPIYLRDIQPAASSSAPASSVPTVNIPQSEDKKSNPKEGKQ